MEQCRRRLCSHDQAGGALLRLAHDSEQRPLPVDLPDDRLQIIDAQALELTQALEYVDSQPRQVLQGKISGAHRFAGARAGSLQQMRFARSGRTADPDCAGVLPGGEPPHVVDRLSVAREQKAREHSAVGQTNTEWKLLHPLPHEGDTGCDHARRVNVET